jgi:hypothetical protein
MLCPRIRVIELMKRWSRAMPDVAGPFVAPLRLRRKAAVCAGIFAGLACLVASAEDAWGEAGPTDTVPTAIGPIRGSEAATETCQTAVAEGGGGEASSINELFTEFHCWLSIQRYRPALAALETACGKADEPECLFDRAYVHHALIEVEADRESENCRISRENYERYLARDPYDTYCDEARSALDELNRICAPAPRPTSPPAKWDPDVIGAIEGSAGLAKVSAGSVHPFQGADEPSGTTGEPTTTDGAKLRAAAWILLGAGAAAGVATGVSWAATLQVDSQLKARTNELSGNLDPKDADNLWLDESRHRYRDLTLVFGGSTLLLLGAGVTLLVLDASSENTLSFGAPGGLPGLSYGGAF